MQDITQTTNDLQDKELLAETNKRIQTIKKIAQSPEEKVIEEMNKKYAVVRTKSTYVLRENFDGSIILETRPSFIFFHENDFFEDLEQKLHNKAKFWLKHPQRRTYDNLIFDPVKPGHHNGNYNMFSGFALSPKIGNCSLYWYHIKEVICDGNEAHYQYLRKWMACVIQKPNLLATGIVLRGLQGTGKNKFVEHFGFLFGKHFLTINSLDHLVGKFNSHLQSAYLIHACEALWGGNKKETGALKALITDPTIFIEGKGKDGFQIENCRHLIVSSNENWAVPMDLDDRRFFCLNVSAKKKENTHYFADLDDQMIKEGGREALLYDLLNEDITNFNPRLMPPNNSGFDMKIIGAKSSERYVYEALNSGGWNIASSENVWEFEDKSCDDLFFLYKCWCEEEDLKKESKPEFGKTLKKLIPSIMKDRPTIEGKRKRFYRFPSLDQCRLEFQQFTKQTNEIWDDVQDEKK